MIRGAMGLRYIVLGTATLVSGCATAGAPAATDWQPTFEQALAEWEEGFTDPGRTENAVRLFATVLDSLDPPLTYRPTIAGYLVDAAFETVPSELTDGLWRYLDAGRSVETVERSLEALDDPRFRSPVQQAELLTLIAAGLSGQIYDPAEFLESGSVAVLERARDRSRSDAATSTVVDRGNSQLDLPVNVGIDELLEWHRGQAFVAADTLVGCNEERLRPVRRGETDEPWRWWGTEAPSQEASPAVPRMTRSEAGRALLGALGTWYGQNDAAGDAGRAEGYLCASSLLDRSAIPVGPFRELVWTYFDRGNIDHVRTLDDEYDGHFHGEDGGYLEPIIDAMVFHPWWWPGWVDHRKEEIGIAILLCIWLCFDHSSPEGTVNVVVP